MASQYLAGNVPRKGYVRAEVNGPGIASVEWQGPERPGEPVLTPGLVDIQLNGFAGIDFSDPGLTVETVVSILPHLWKTGVTSFCPTLITNSVERIARNLRVLEEARSLHQRFAATVPCYHLEGPYLSPGKARGAHDPSYMHAPDWDEFQELQRAAGGRIGIVTLAPELLGALPFIARASATGVVVALGHTMASADEIHAAVEAGARLSTHLGNGCPQTLDRHANPLWPQMARDELYASIICDTFHLPPDLVKVIVRMKGIDRTILITDAVHVAKLPPGRYSIVGTEIELLPTGKVVRADGASLAGSALAMCQAVARFMRLSGASLADALRAATHTPAALLGRPGVCPEIAAGAPANLVLARPLSDTLEVLTTYLQGEEVYRAGR